MKGANAEPTSRIGRPPVLDLPRVLVAAATTAASSTVAQALRDAGYIVSTTLTGSVPRELRKQKAIELLVLDGSEGPWRLGSTVESVRSVNWALPIVLIARPDPVLRAEAETLGVEVILETPVAADEIRRAATRIVPVVPDVELDLAG
jgi:DNA-binding response OmpR family regulator